MPAAITRKQEEQQRQERRQQQQPAKVYDINQYRQKKHLVTWEGLKQATKNILMIGAASGALAWTVITGVSAFFIYIFAIGAIYLQLSYIGDYAFSVLPFLGPVWMFVFFTDILMLFYIKGTSQTNWSFVLSKTKGFLLTKWVLIPLIAARIIDIGIVQQYAPKTGLALLFVLSSTAFWSICWLWFVGNYAKTWLHTAFAIAFIFFFFFQVYDVSQLQTITSGTLPTAEQRNLVLVAVKDTFENSMEAFATFWDRIFVCPTEGRIDDIDACVQEKRIARNPEKYAPKIEGSIDQDIKEFVRVSLGMPALLQQKFTKGEQVEIGASLDVQIPSGMGAVAIRNSCEFKRGERKPEVGKVVPESITVTNSDHKDIVCYIPANTLVPTETEASQNPSFLGTITSEVTGITSNARITNLFMNKEQINAELTDYIRQKRLEGADRQQVLPNLLSERYGINTNDYYPSGRVESRANPGLAIAVLWTSEQQVISISPTENNDKVLLRAGIQNQDNGKITGIESFTIELPNGFAAIPEECPNFAGQQRLSLRNVGVISKKLEDLNKGDSIQLGTCNLRITDSLLLRKTDRPEPRTFKAEMKYNYRKEIKTTITVGATGTT